MILNSHIILFFLGGLFSLILTVIILYAKQEYKRNLERDRLKRLLPEEVGDIESVLNDSFEFGKLNFFSELTKYGVQPLFILSFINLFTNSNSYSIICTFLLTIITIAHEFYLASKYSDSSYYRIFIACLWIILYIIILFTPTL
jgi:hypothetical protein